MSVNPQILTVDELQSLTRKPREAKTPDTASNDGNEMRELWARLLVTVQSSSVSDSHMTAACNALCFVVRANANSQDGDLKIHAHSIETWRQTFHAARCAFASGKNKPALQVLETLQYLLQSSPEHSNVREAVDEAAMGMARIVFSHSPRRSLKEACTVLYFFLRKLSDSMSFSGVLERAFEMERAAFYRLYQSSNLSSNREDYRSPPPLLAFVLALLFAVRIADSKSATLKLLSLLCSIPTPTYQIDFPSFLSRSIDLYSTADESALDAVTRDVLPSILTTKSIFISFLSTQGELDKDSVSAKLVILGLLQHGKNKSFIAESDIPERAKQYCLPSHSRKTTIPPLQFYGLLLSHSSASIRLRACELLLSSTSPTMPFPPGTLECLTDNLAYLHNDNDAFNRGELLSIFRRFLTRLHQSQRALRNHATGDQSNPQLHEYDTFHQRYLPFLRSELTASVSYPRHVLALQLLDSMTKNTVSVGSVFPDAMLADRDLLPDLFYLVLDPYEDIRILASSILARAAALCPHAYQDAIRTLDPVRSTSRLAVATNRADHADACGHMLSLSADGVPPGRTTVEGSTIEQLVEFLHSHISSLEEFSLTGSTPLHGTILGIMYMIEAYTKRGGLISESLVSTLLDTCHKIWLLSQPQLCVDSPEMEFESTENMDFGPKDLLAYSWRALRDSNLLMQAMLRNLNDHPVLVEQVGNMCFDQLALLRHRGAFSTVAQTFVICCQQAHSSANTEVHGLISQWFSKAMNELERQADKLTRRSAGLPAMFGAVFSTVNQQQFLKSFKILVSKAEEPPPDIQPGKVENNLRLPQVHALNCLKEIMTSSRFRVMTEPLVVFTLNLAANCMGSSTWAIKNCGLMLLRASINRLDPDTGLGDAEAGMKIRCLSSTDRRALDVAIDFLGQSVSTSSSGHEKSHTAKTQAALTGESAETEFAGLDILARLFINQSERARVQDLAVEKLQHPLWHIRAQAARVLAVLIPEGYEIRTLEDVVPTSESQYPQSHNETHGFLMLAENLVRKLQRTKEMSAYKAAMINALTEFDRATTLWSNDPSMAKRISVLNQLSMGHAGEYTVVENLRVTFEEAALCFLQHSGQHDALCLREMAICCLHYHTVADIGLERAINLLVECADDVLVYVLDVFVPDPSPLSCMRYLEVLIRTAQGRPAERCIAAVMHTIASNVSFKDLCLDEGKLQDLVKLLNFESMISRDMLRSQIGFFAILCRWSWNQGHLQVLDNLKIFSGSYCLHLRIAADDEIEFDTRCTTVEALQHWESISDPDKLLTYMFEPEHRLDILTIIYDLLNDDDDEIRDKASLLTSTLLPDTTDAGDIRLMSLCAAASRKTLLHHIAQDFKATRLLGAECLRRILGEKILVSRERLENEISQRLISNNVTTRTQRILNVMNDLFGEEKQNLYADEVAEIKAWAVMFDNTSLSGGSVMNKLATWAEEGVNFLVMFLQGRHPMSKALFSTDNGSSVQEQGEQLPSHSTPRLMFGTCTTLDLEILILRVVICMIISGKGDCVALKELHKACVTLSMSQMLLSAFTWSFDRP